MRAFLGKRHHLIELAGICLVLAALACNAPSSAPPTPTLALPTAATPPQVAEASPTPLPTLAATDTPAPDVEGPGGCTLNAAYVADVSVPDNTEFAPGVAFTKIWRLRNSGTCTWETGTKLAFISGDAMDGPASVNLPSAASGAKTDVSVGLVAPQEYGTYRGNWQAQAPDGTRFGSVIYVQIVVPAPATKTPTPTKTPTATLTITATATTTPTTPTVPTPFDVVWEALGGEDGSLGHPESEAVLVRWTADQQFETGYMFWRNNEGSPRDYIYVLTYQGGTDPTSGDWERYRDDWTEEMNDLTCAEADTPNGPFRGFGKVWCEHQSVRQGIGTATEPEAGFYGGFQDFEDGTLLWSPRLHYIYALFDYGTWERLHE